MNATHLRALPHDELWHRLSPFLLRAGLVLPSGAEWQSRAIEVFKTSMEVLADAVELFRPLSLTDLTITPEGQETLTWEKSKAVISRWRDLLKSGEEYISAETFSVMQNQIAADVGVKGKHLFMPIRVAVIGKPQGAELKNLVPLLSTQVLADRAQSVLNAAGG